MLDGSGWPLAELGTTELNGCRWKQVEAAFAQDKGEGDRSLAFWRLAHRKYSSRLGSFSEDMQLFCERFRLAEHIDA
jgi:uncharacterized protein YhfF